MNLEYIRQVNVERLEHELSLARASSDYWRDKYIASRNVNDGFTFGGRWTRLNAAYWFERAARSPLDECDE